MSGLGQALSEASATLEWHVIWNLKMDDHLFGPCQHGGPVFGDGTGN